MFLALAVGAFFAAPGAATLSRRYGPRWVVTIGMTLEAIGIVATTLLISTSVNGLMLAVPLFVYGMGVGFATAQLTSIVLVGHPGGAVRDRLGRELHAAPGRLGAGHRDPRDRAVLDPRHAQRREHRGRDAERGAGLPGAGRDDLVDASAGQVLPVLRNPTAAAGAAFGGTSTLPPDQVACFSDPAFLASLRETVVPIENAFVDAARFAGFAATGFVLLGVVFSLLLPAQRPRPVAIPARETVVAEGPPEPA